MKFKVGDHVIVITTNYDDPSYKQSGLMGTVATLGRWYMVKYDAGQGASYLDNTYQDDDIELSAIHDSPLLQALR